MKPENYPVNPPHLWNLFFDFTQTPRPSKKEDKIISYLVNLAQENNLKYVLDKASNVIIYVPGKNGREKDDPLIIQNHIDMVTDAIVGRKINFSEDPIETVVEGDWLTAIGTTLGADNGIGCAAALATIFDESLIHPPLELLFTVDEETGLNGALGLESDYLKGRKMLNLDTEEWGSLYIGCAGGIDYELSKKVDMQPHSIALDPYILTIEGFIGGHSGVDIHEQRGNAIKFLAEILDEFSSVENIEISEIRAGKAHNIIPRDAFVRFYMKKESESLLLDVAEAIQKRWMSFSPQKDKNFDFRLERENNLGMVIGSEESKQLINYLVLFPHGVHTYDLSDRSLVSMSNNFAKFLFVNGSFYTQSSLRFFDREEVKSLERQIRKLGDLFKMSVENHSEYPSWKPVRENPVLDLVKEVYEDLYSKKPNVTAIHAGLECGILRDKIGPIDVISFGPTITGAHSPDERVNIPSVAEFWNLFKEVLKRI